jgi:hypothetical protein
MIVLRDVISSDENIYKKYEIISATGIERIGFYIH